MAPTMMPPSGRTPAWRRRLASSALMLCALWGLASLPAAEAQFDLTVVGAGIMDWSFLDAALTHPGNDIAIGNTGWAELVLRCERGTDAPMQVQLPSVDIPDVWYDNLDHYLGTWNRRGGEALYCEAWECDNVIGCANGYTPTAAPNPGLGDDYMGVMKIDPYDFRVSKTQFQRSGRPRSTHSCRFRSLSGRLIESALVPFFSSLLSLLPRVRACAAAGRSGEDLHDDAEWAEQGRCVHKVRLLLRVGAEPGHAEPEAAEHRGRGQRASSIAASRRQHRRQRG